MAVRSTQFRREETLGIGRLIAVIGFVDLVANGKS